MSNRKIDMDIGERFMGGQIKPYSTSIAAVWEVIEKVGDGDMVVQFSRRDNTIVAQLSRLQGVKLTSSMATGPTFAHAICLAILNKDWE